MRAIQTIIAAMADAMTPDGTLMRMRFRVTLDMLVTLVVTVLAVALAVGYQVTSRIGRRSSPTA